MGVWRPVTVPPPREDVFDIVEWEREPMPGRPCVCECDVVRGKGFRRPSIGVVYPDSVAVY